MAAIEGTWEAVIIIRIAVPPGQSPEDAGKQLANAGVSLPIGLVRWVRHVDISIVPALDGPVQKLHLD